MAVAPADGSAAAGFGLAASQYAGGSVSRPAEFVHRSHYIDRTSDGLVRTSAAAVGDVPRPLR